MKTKEQFTTTHKLDFYAAPWIDGMVKYCIGTCTGIYFSTNKSYCILAIVNDKQNNGHLNDVFEWFENSCRRDKKTLKVLELWNSKFKKHLIEKRGFKDIGDNDVEKTFAEEYPNRKRIQIPVK